jgi:hypothetical protein
MKSEYLELLVVGWVGKSGIVWILVLVIANIDSI